MPQISGLHSAPSLPFTHKGGFSTWFLNSASPRRNDLQNTCGPFEAPYVYRTYCGTWFTSTAAVSLLKPAAVALLAAAIAGNHQTAWSGRQRMTRPEPIQGWQTAITRRTKMVCMLSGKMAHLTLRSVTQYTNALRARNASFDVMQIDVVWPPNLAQWLAVVLSISGCQ